MVKIVIRKSPMITIFAFIEEESLRFGQVCFLEIVVYGVMSNLYHVGRLLRIAHYQLMLS